MHKLKKISLMILIALYVLAGCNHFRVPEFYYAIMPVDLLYPEAVNTIAGIVEILLGLLLISPKTRPWAAWGIILMLITFLQIHVSMALKAPFQLGNMTVSSFLAWFRLALQFVLIYWAWWHSKTDEIEVNQNKA